MSQSWGSVQFLCGQSLSSGPFSQCFRVLSDDANGLAQQSGIFDRSPEEAEFAVLVVGRKSVLVQDHFVSGLPARLREVGQSLLEGFLELPLAVKSIRPGHFQIVVPIDGFGDAIRRGACVIFLKNHVPTRSQALACPPQVPRR